MVVAYAALIIQLFSFLSSFSSGLTAGSVLNFGDLVAISSIFQGLMAGMGILSLAGFVLFMVAMYFLANHYNEPRIFRNLLKALLINIGTVVTAIVILVLSIFSVLGSAVLLNPANVSSLFLNLLIVILLVVVVCYAVSIYCGVLYKRSFDILAAKSGVGDFRTAGLLYLIGAILPIPIIAWISWLFATLGYHKLKPDQPSVVVNPPPQDTPTTKRCSNCGAENVADASYCCACGNQI
jgi:uncharacterized membrane protein